MDRTAPDTVVQAILDAPSRAVLLTGPAAAGKTSAALGVYRAFLDEAGRPGCLLVLPNFPAAEAIKRRMLAESDTGVIVGPQVVTFSALSGRVLAAAGDETRPLAALDRSLLIRRIVDELQAERALESLWAVADTPGIVTALDRAIAELKRAAVDPEALAEAMGEARGKNRDLLAVYRRYQKHLQDLAAVDVEGQAWLARDALRDTDSSAPPPGLAGVRAIAVDGFTDFTPTQLEILALLAPRVGRVLITLPLADDGRERLWHWTRRSAGRVRAALGEDLTELAAAPAGRGEMARVADTVFDMDAAREDAPAGLAVISATGMEAEVAAVARRVKQLLVGRRGEAARGDNATARGGGTAARGEDNLGADVLVTARSLEVYGGVIERVFAAHGIPLAPRPVALTDVPLIRFLLTVAGLAPEFESAAVLAAVKSSYFQPDALGAYDAHTVAVAEMVIREGNVLAGRSAYADAAARLAGRLAPRADEDDDGEDAPPGRLGPIETTPQALAAASEMLQKLFDLAEAGLADLPALAEKLQLPQAACELPDAELLARDLRALAALRAAAASLAEAPGDLAHIREALSCVRCGGARGESAVACLDVLDARAVRFRHVFCLGLGEGTFPQRHSDSPLLTEADRRDWAPRGAVLDGRSDLAAREMLLLYLTASRASESLTLSYLSADASGSPGAPSSFLLGLLAPYGGLEGVAVEHIPPGEFFPAEGDLACGRDAINAAVAGLLGGAAPAEAALAWTAREHPERLARSAAGVWAQHRRWTGREPDAFDGRLTDPALQAELADRYPAHVVFSASRLNTYGQCPWQYFARYVLRLEPLPQPERRLEPTTRGTFIHNVLCRLLRRLAGPKHAPVPLGGLELDKLTAALDEALAAESSAVLARGVPYPVLWDIQRQQMRQEILTYLHQCRQPPDQAALSLHSELAFGMGESESSGPGCDRASLADPVALGTSAGTVLLRGKVDRVDLVADDRGQEDLLIVDYKTGMLPRPGDILAGASLQLPLYAHAAAVLLDRDCLGGAFHRVGGADRTTRRYFAAVTPKKGEFVAVDEYAEQLEQVVDTIGRFVAGMRAGRFDLAPAHACPSYCPYRQICHYSPARAAIKAPAAAEAGP